MAEPLGRIACNPLQPLFPPSLIGDISFSPTRFGDPSEVNCLPFGAFLLNGWSIFRCKSWLALERCRVDSFPVREREYICCFASIYCHPTISY
jgi:hypothetical protein